MNKFLFLFLIYTHIDGMTNKEHQNSSKETSEREIKNHKTLIFFHVQSHPQIQHQEIFKDEHVLFSCFF
jgi:hypothetical protein